MAASAAIGISTRLREAMWPGRRSASPASTAPQVLFSKKVIPAPEAADEEIVREIQRNPDADRSGVLDQPAAEHSWYPVRFPLPSLRTETQLNRRP